jgi:hypothetical protein
MFSLNILVASQNLSSENQAAASKGHCATYSVEPCQANDSMSVTINEHAEMHVQMN